MTKELINSIKVKVMILEADGIHLDLKPFHLMKVEEMKNLNKILEARMKENGYPVEFIVSI